jgi:hypothetical protein
VIVARITTEGCGLSGKRAATWAGKASQFVKERLPMRNVRHKKLGVLADP